MELNWSVILFALSLSVALSASVRKETERNEVTKTTTEEGPRMLPVRVETGNKRKTTADVLRHIGMTRMKNPGSHHRKRLASQSRKSHSGDSHMYIIKLPHNPYYYDSEPAKGSSQSHNVNRIPVSFKSNGKPGKIYHWNLPEVKKMVARKTSAKAKDANQVFKPTIWVGDEPHRRVSYYKPKKPSKNAFQKYFPGNGKPHALYVIESKKRTGSLHRIKE
ncbi:uncharacterized protein LOC106665249 [Cimex lectularius]|uniref:Uncharacterized protein n=1 Tax=Cimex lectularius TaxID=79782 RepID=A0A8I6TFP5_CIMLE|nr:uncharacterized protein LOC106665249 [Cimex lectularius]XP_014247042.1 uncharacterized protein LOC106665249 [Cimex lectularius]